jgi:hypothetical protein
MPPMAETPEASTAASPSVVVRLSREPLVRFVALGVLLFSIDRALAGDPPPDDSHRIVVTDGLVEALAVDWEERHGTRPNEEEARTLLDAFVREEALSREARAAGLDAGDRIVRRRLVQKLEFLLAGTVEPGEPDDAALTAWIAAHPDAFRSERRTTLRHVFFSRDARGARAESDAVAALASIRAGGDERGDPFLRGASIGPSTDVQLDAALGAGAADALAAMPLETWSGPWSGTYGSHLVFVSARVAARDQSLDEARTAASAAWMEDARARAVEGEVERILSSYDVVREDGTR